MAQLSSHSGNDVSRVYYSPDGQLAATLSTEITGAQILFWQRRVKPIRRHAHSSTVPCVAGGCVIAFAREVEYSMVGQISLPVHKPAAPVLHAQTSPAATSTMSFSSTGQQVFVSTPEHDVCAFTAPELRPPLEAVDQFNATGTDVSAVTHLRHARATRPLQYGSRMLTQGVSLLLTCFGASILPKWSSCKHIRTTHPSARQPAMTAASSCGTPAAAACSKPGATKARSLVTCSGHPTEFT